MSSPEPSQDSVAANVAQWTQTNAEFTDPAAERHWSEEEIRWGVFGIPESQIGCLGEVDGLDVVELGCGTAYFSARLARLGARPVGVDPTPAQLETARRMQAQTGQWRSRFASRSSIALISSSRSRTSSRYSGGRKSM